MPRIHFLNVKQGDCTILEHNSGRTTVFDICSGNIERQRSAVPTVLAKSDFTPTPGNFRMCNHPTNPLEYLTRLQKTELWRFILSHPDMDHLDGFDALLTEFSVLHLWDSGARKQQPEFGSAGKYREEDWDRYARVIAGDEGDIRSIQVRSGAKFKYANQDDTVSNVGDSLHILAPDDNLIQEGNRTQDFNDASYVVLYRSAIGTVLLAGDAHDKTWDYIKENYKSYVSNIDLLIAPHHGRKSGRSYKFLDYVNPKLTLFGCAPSGHLAYDAWNYRKLPHITNNQCGCIVAEGDDTMNIYVENRVFAEKSGGNPHLRNAQGFYYLCHLLQ